MESKSSGILALGLFAACVGCTSEPVNSTDDSNTANTSTANTSTASTGTHTASTANTTTSTMGTSTTGTPEPPDLHLRFEEVDLEAPPPNLTDFTFFPNGTDFLALSKLGEVVHYRLVEADDPDEGASGAERLGEFQLPGVHTETDCGAISLVLDNDFDENQIFYLAKCTSQQASGVYRYVFDAEDYASIADSEALIIVASEPASERAWHNVGSLNMDADGNLWVPFGDKTIDANAQDRANNLGALLRIVPNRTPGESGYTPAPDNPFVGEDDASPDIYAYGLRSPWRATLDQQGRPWFGDVGSVLVEELNVVTEPGQNFGWSNAEGVCVDDCTGLTDPVTTWDRNPDHDYLVEDPEAPALSVRVATVATSYDPSVNDRYQGTMDDQMLFGDACLGFVRAIEFTDHLVSDVPVGHLRTAAAMHQAADGYIYALTFGRCQTDNPLDIDNEGGLFRAVLDTGD